MHGFENGERDGGWVRTCFTVSKLNDTDALKVLLAQFLARASKDRRIGEEERGEASERQKGGLLGKDTSRTLLPLARHAWTSTQAVNRWQIVYRSRRQRTCYVSCTNGQVVANSVRAKCASPTHDAQLGAPS